MKHLLLLFLLVLFSATAEAGIHRCKNPAGETYFSDKPCATKDEQVSVKRSNKELKVLKGERMIREKDFAPAAQDVRKRCMKRPHSGKSRVKKTQLCDALVQWFNDCRIEAIKQLPEPVWRGYFRGAADGMTLKQAAKHNSASTEVWKGFARSEIYARLEAFKESNYACRDETIDRLDEY